MVFTEYFKFDFDYTYRIDGNFDALLKIRLKLFR